jgi:hypothetical protein
LVTDNSRPKIVIHDRPLYGKQFCIMEFICVPTTAVQEAREFGRFGWSLSGRQLQPKKTVTMKKHQLFSVIILKLDSS